MTGFTTYVPICCRSKGQKGVTLSSSKAEYIEMSEAFKEIRFIHFLLKEMVIDVTVPIVVRCYNVEAISMVEKLSSGVTMRPINTRYHFVCEHVC
jgi:hypothetical protein